MKLIFSDIVILYLNPNLAFQAPVINPCRFTYSEIVDHHDDLASLLNSFQRHTKCSNRCLKQVGDRQVCRYGFPYPLNDESKFEKVNDIIKFIPRRNDTLIAKYNATITRSWRANTDFSVVTSMSTVVGYLAKYASKAEIPSRSFKRVLQNIADGHDDAEPGYDTIRNAIISTVAERDYSIQEVCHVLIGWPLCASSRSYITIVLNDDDWAPIDENRTTTIDKYKRREKKLEALSLFNYTSNYTVENGESKCRSKPAILRVFPYVRLGDDIEMNERYYKVHVSLQVPWRNSPEELMERPDDGGQFNSWEVYFFYEVSAENDLDFKVNQEDEGGFIRQDPHQVNIERALALMRGEEDALEVLGERDMDINLDWRNHLVYPIDNILINQFLNRLGAIRIQHAINNTNVALSDDQQDVLDQCLDQINELRHGREPHVKKSVVQGKAETGKSTVIQAMCYHIVNAFGNNSVKFLALTGVAANNIHGSTLNSFLKITQGSIKELAGESKRKFETE